MFETRWNVERFYGEHARTDCLQRWNELRRVRKHVVRFTDQEWMLSPEPGRSVGGEMVYVVAWPGAPAQRLP